jgi:hypothetical protein
MRPASFRLGKRDKVTAKGGATEWIHWQSGAAQVLRRLIAGRTEGPLTERRARESAPTLDVCPTTGRARRSYRRAEDTFEESGSIAWRAATALRGRLLPDAGGDFWPPAFPGQYRDPETGLHYNLARYYDPDTADPNHGMPRRRRQEQPRALPRRRDSQDRAPVPSRACSCSSRCIRSRSAGSG